MEEDGDGVVAEVGDGEVELAVIVEVGGEDGVGILADGDVHGHAEGAITFADEEHDVVRREVDEGGRGRPSAVSELRQG